MPEDIRLPVRHLAEFVLRSGSIDSRFTGLDRGVQGTRLHRMLQKRSGRQYKAEVALSIEIPLGPFCYHLHGRADGVIENGSEVTVDEIKTTARLLETIEEDDYPAHWAQGCVYAHILCCTRRLPGARVQLRYCNIETTEVKTFVRAFTAKELEAFTTGLLKQYERWAVLAAEWKQKRDASLQALPFPFAEYREGQRHMAVGCYQTFKEGGRLFCCAPTGIGKTVSALFPAMKALGEGVGERIFYLTAKTITRKAAEEAVERMGKTAPLHFRSITLTAKDKVCFLDQRACLPESCPYANGYYDRINDALYTLLQTQQAFSRTVLEDYARQNKLCPYELSLDLAEWCDAVVCDYNYLFDPVVHLMRFFEGRGGDYLFLVDEAHNLVDRSREMYSARLRKSDYFAFKKNLPKQHTALHKALSGVNSAFVALRKQVEEAGEGRVLALASLPAELQKPLEKFAAATEAFLEDHRGSEEENELLALYFEVLFYQRIAEGFDERYTALVYQYGSDVVVKLLCLDASSFLDESMALGRASVLFSATLQPLPYYRETLGGGPGAKLLSLGSPFAPENLGLFIADRVSTKYADRSASLAPVADLLADLVRGKQGNYIAYFPSYAYMQQVLETFCSRHPQVHTHVQSAGMDEAAREEFLAAFERHPTASMLGFCVLGGVFSEGVDLVGSRLIGTAVVGVGLPQIGPEPNAIRRYYDEQNGHGFEFAYQFPGMNKVLQAAGRVIRAERDRGVVLLIDSRFTSARYRAMFPPHWAHWQRTTAEALPGQLAAFWQAQ